MNVRQKTAAVDFDGVLFEDVPDVFEGWRENRPLKMIPGADHGTAWLKKQGFEIAISTCRPHYMREFMERAMCRAGIQWDVILFYTKPHADVYIDDKAIRFSNWGQVAESICPQAQPTGQEPNALYEEALKRVRLQHLNWTGVKTVLDVGCGRNPIWPEGVVGDVVEPNADFRIQAAALPCVEDAFEDVMFAGPSMDGYDLVLVCGVLEHVEDPAGLLKRLADCRRMFVTVPNGGSFHRRLGMELGLLRDLEEMSAHDAAVGHQRYYVAGTFDRLIQRFADENGFTNVRFGSSGLKFADNATMGRHVGLALELDAVGKATSLTGDCNFLGAELYAELQK